LADRETIDVKPVPMIGQLLNSGKVQTTIFGDRSMSTQLYDARELTPEWKKARERTISYCKSKNHTESSIDNARRISNVVATNMMSLGVNDPREMRESHFNDWIDGSRAGSFRSKPISEDTLAKRVETLKNICRAYGLDAQLSFVANWKAKRVQKDIVYWSVEEMDAMYDAAMDWMRSPGKMPMAIAHLIHYQMAPRISDTVRLEWSSIDLDRGEIRFRASKNGKMCIQYLTDPVVRALHEYRELVSGFEGGSEYLFPVSILSRKSSSGSPFVSVKTMRNWLRSVSVEASERTGLDIRGLKSHCYRHTLAMRYLDRGGDYIHVSMVLGDEVATIEKYYSELKPNRAQRMAFEKAFAGSDFQDSSGTVQPGGLKRRSDRNSTVLSSTTNSSSGPYLVADRAGFEPTSPAPKAGRISRLP